MTATLFHQIDSATDELEDSFWSLLHSVAEETGTPAVDVLSYFKRTAIDRLRSLKPTHGVDRADDGRAAFWRYRVLIWHMHADSGDLLADSDPDKRRDGDAAEAGASVIAGLPNLAREALAMVESYHAAADLGWTIDGLTEPVLLAKLRSLRVALSNQNGECVWRIRYLLQPPAEGAAPPVLKPGSLRGIHHTASTAKSMQLAVHVIREMSAPRVSRVASM